MDITKDNTDWSDAELAAAVEAYLKMLAWEKSGQPFNKALENRLLREGPIAGRAKGSVEFRMLNISTVLIRMGLEPIKGFKPAKNVGSGVEQRIRQALSGDGFHLRFRPVLNLMGEPIQLYDTSLQMENNGEMVGPPPPGAEPPPPMRPVAPPAAGAVVEDVVVPSVEAWSSSVLNSGAALSISAVSVVVRRTSASATRSTSVVAVVAAPPTPRWRWQGRYRNCWRKESGCIG